MKKINTDNLERKSYHVNHSKREVRWNHGYFLQGLSRAKKLGYSYPIDYDLDLTNENHKQFFNHWKLAFWYDYYQTKQFFYDLHILRRLDKRGISFKKYLKKVTIK